MANLIGKEPGVKTEITSVTQRQPHPLSADQ
jgi:hypothetical protein